MDSQRKLLLSGFMPLYWDYSPLSV